ncbi:TPA: glutamine amidotransferase [Kluyvera intermedia]|jgi:GMP synthase (glutamine-hydrolysing)|uniref:Glutamine amidotransferase n=3 Tax=Enterobacteriaceae TaxID=543 RepID=A0A9P3WHF4_KLUIN|nr:MULTISPECIES: glutamine amidotransferase [Enterobacteriaceae]MDU6686860.1 glutamine amidotransferase [Enterobacteriaceae bacterium]HAT2204112.1 glutamine amidotransferase [Kluyvera intermedia]AKL12515.1 glutamine amidotransferase [Phytobacter ursingii]MCL9671399.1 glutamine amidotransferase [Citrobacter sp. MNAZ 1397]HAT2514825.1 glutamine amidotransferase [Kluyvera intermedia]
MKTAVVFRHVPFEDLDSLGETLLAKGYRWRYIDTPVQSLSALDPLADDVLIVLGGPIGVYEQSVYPFLETEMRIIRERLTHGKPVLGICLGAQLMAAALGAKVASMGVKEIGYFPITVSDAAPAYFAPLHQLPVLHWHGDRFEIPAGAAHLASSAVCDNQAFSVGNHGLGFQFHLEVTATGLEGWLVGHACELSHAGIDPRTLRDDAARYSARLASAARQVTGNWLDNLTA